MPTRRRFIRDCSVLATAASLTPAIAIAQDRSLLAGQPGFGRFAQQLNSPFNVRTSNGIERLVLVEATRSEPTSPRAEDGRNERYSLLFRGPVHPKLPQGTYEFEHPRLGRLPIFITPIESTDISRSYYEAVFNHAISFQDLTAQLSRAPRSARKR